MVAPGASRVRVTGAAVAVLIRSSWAGRRSFDRRLAVLRAACRAIGRDVGAGRRRPRRLQLQPGIEATLRKEALAGADDDREHEQVQPVDELVLQQEPQEPAAAVDLELAVVRPRLEVTHGLLEV